MSKCVVTMTIYVNMEVFCFIQNCLHNSFTFNNSEVKEVSLKKSKKYPYELQVPIMTLSGFAKKNKTKINLQYLQELNNGEF